MKSTLRKSAVVPSVIMLLTYLTLATSSLFANESANLQKGENVVATGVAEPLYDVISCNDGDTCALKNESMNIKRLKVRLVGIDAPEMSGKKKKAGQEKANEAKEYLNKLVAGKKVRVRSYGEDIYKRQLAEMFVDDLNVNIEMLKLGYAEVYKGKAPVGLPKQDYEFAQQQAQTHKTGIWSLKKYMSPKEFRSKNR